MTNFEKWKSELTVEDMIYEASEENEVIGLDCENCPAANECRASSDIGCGIWFRQWAEQEVSE